MLHFTNQNAVNIISIFIRPVWKHGLKEFGVGAKCLQLNYFDYM